MTCADHNWTFKFLDSDEETLFEVRPVTMSLTASRTDYDFCRVKFSRKVGEAMKPHTKYSSGSLSGRRLVDACYNGTAVHRFLFKPDKAEYGQDFTYIDLVDLHKSLGDGIIDKQWETVKIREAYNYVIEKATNGLIKGPVFTIPENIENELVGEAALDGDPDDDNADGEGFAIREAREPGGDLDRIWRKHTTVERIEQDRSKKLTDSYFAIDLERVGPEKALMRLNEKFGIKTWFNENGVLSVGFPEARSVVHAAAPRDQRVWRYKDPSISHPRDPIKTVVVEGSWVDAPGVGGFDDLVGWFDQGEENRPGDVIATGFATRTDIDEGVSFTVKNTDAKRDALPTMAETEIREKMKEQNSGSIQIDPALSGHGVTKVHQAMPGDFIRLFPPTEPDECGYEHPDDTYLISEVSHKISEGGKWMTDLDLVFYPDSPVRSFMRYFDPTDERYYTEEKALDNDWVEDLDI
jgi:hypothetical protein